MDLSHLFRLMTWLSPSFPVGSYTYSHGLEFAVQEGLVQDRVTLAAWLEGILRYGTGRMDAALFVAAYRASPCDLEALVQLATALRGTREFSQESLLQGRAFMTTLQSSWTTCRSDDTEVLTGGADTDLPYAVAVALACRQHVIPPACALAAFLHAFVGNLVSAGIRLIPIGHTDGQIVLAQMETPVTEAVQVALQSQEADWGSATPMVDWTSMQHEIQYTRLFRS